MLEVAFYPEWPDMTIHVGSKNEDVSVNSDCFMDYFQALDHQPGLTIY
jgi:hypothetical protein